MRHSNPVRLGKRNYRLVGTVSNPEVGIPKSGQAYSVRVETAPTGPDKSGSKPRGESVHLFLESTVVR